MATGGQKLGGNEYKGHPQPPVDERLEASSNFLADEDRHRYLDFESKIAEIEEFVAHIEKEEIPCDGELLDIVKSKLKVQRDWERSQAAEPLCGDALSIQTYSNRLISNETALMLEQQREEWGVVYQTREDEAVFTVEPEDDHQEFLQRMNADASKDPDEINPDENLLWVESRAYGWAVNEPAMIPYWMHPTMGIPKKAPRVIDEPPWYRDPAQARKSLNHERPARGWIPNYLLEREKKINALLRKSTKESGFKPGEYELLEELLHFHEPKEVRVLHDRILEYEEGRKWKNLKDTNDQEMEKLTREFEAAFSSWVAGFQAKGVFLIVRIDGSFDNKTSQHGVFYVDHGLLDSKRESLLRRANIMLRKYITDEDTLLDRGEKESLKTLLSWSWPDEVQTLIREKCKLIQEAEVKSDQQLAPEKKAIWNSLVAQENKAINEWKKTLDKDATEFKYLRPGEMAQASPTTLYIPWNLTIIQHHPAVPCPEPELTQEASRIQQLLNDGFAREYPTGLDDGNVGFVLLLQQVAYPRLRDHLKAYLAMQGRELEGEDKEYFDNYLSPLVNQLWNNWIEGFSTGVKEKRVIVKMHPFDMPDEDPSILYCRSDSECAAPLDDINKLLLQEIDLESTTSDSALAQKRETFYREADRLLKPYQHTYLSELERTDQLKHEALFRKWVRSKKGLRVRTKRPNRYIDPDDDPIVVYYRGPLETAEDLRKSIAKEDLEFIRTSGDEGEDYIKGLGQKFYSFIQKGLEGPHSDQYFRLGQWYLRDLRRSDEQRPIKTPSKDLPAIDDEEDADAANLILDPVIKARAAEHRSQIKPKNSRSDTTLENAIYRLMNAVPEVYERIRSIETELRRILSSKRRKKADTLRLYVLLEQFMNFRTYAIWERYKKLIGTGGPEEQGVKAEFKRRVVPWINRLRDSDFSIIPPFVARFRDERETYSQRGRGGDLVFQTRSMLRRPGRLTLIVPYVSTAQCRNEKATSLADLTMAKFELDSGGGLNSQFSSATIRKIEIVESRINQLLSRKAALEVRGEQLSWEESEELIENFRQIMPRYLVELDKEVLHLDNRTRTEGIEIDDAEKSRFQRLSEHWSYLFTAWLNLIPQRIRIDRGNAEDANYTQRDQRFRFQDLDDELAIREKRLKDPPIRVKRQLDLLNKILKEKSRLEELSLEEQQRLRIMVSPFFRKPGEELRRDIPSLMMMYLGIELEKNKPLRPENQALIETLISEYFNLFLTLCMNKEPFEEIAFQEPLPGQIRLIYNFSKEFEKTQTHADVIWPDLFSLHESRAQFLKLAKTIDEAARIDPILTLSERTLIETQLKPLSHTDIQKLYQDIQHLLRQQQAGPGDLSAAEQQELCEKDTRLLWFCWAFNNPELAKRISANPVVDPSDRLTRRRLPGSQPFPLPATIPRPDEGEVKELEIELNNLISRWRHGRLQVKERNLLLYLMDPFLSMPLRYLKARMDETEKDFAVGGGLDFPESIEFSDAREDFEAQVEKALTSIPAHGLFLDTNWFLSTAIAEACARARLWSKETMNSDGTYNYPITRDYIEDVHLRTLHDMYAALKEHVNRRWLNSEELRRQFLVSMMPKELIVIKEELENPPKLQAPVVRNLNPQANDPRVAELDRVVGALQPIQLERDFIAQYMVWLAGLPFEQLRAALAPSNVVSIDFTSKAERRGIQRAAIEMALNLLATNQEQHRPSDRFRVLDVSGQQYYAPDKEVPINLPLEPWKRPLEANPFEYTKKLLSYRRWKDFDYKLARERTIRESGRFVNPPANYLGPFALADGDTYMEAARKRQVHLAEVAAQMQEAQLKAPREQMAKLITAFSQGLANSLKQTDTLYDELPLPDSGIELLVEISGPSWDENRIEYNDPKVLAELANCRINPDPDLLNEFEREVEAQTIPLQDRSSPGQRAIVLWHRINDIRAQSQELLRNWSRQEAQNYLKAMHFARRIYLSNHDRRLEEMDVWKIPLSGHPENKYVYQIPKLGVFEPLGVRFVGSNKRPVVKYDSHGREGPPIYQPNKDQYLLKLAWRLGRDLRRCMSLIESDTYVDTRTCLLEQYQGLTDSLKAMADITPADRSASQSSNDSRKVSDPNITLKSLALPLAKLEPDLFQEIQEFDPELKDPEEMTEKHAAQMLQKQIIEEVSNNWELRFPEKERVWDFASVRLAEVEKTINGRTVQAVPRVRKFFDMRRFPVGCQSDATKTLIEQSGPIIQEEPKPVEEPQPLLTSAQIRAQNSGQLVKTDRHIRGQRPSFPFGETPYQAAYQSFRMEQDLKDVPEFQPRKRRRRFFNRRDSDDDEPRFKERYPLPELPKEWQPDNISMEAKRRQIINTLKRTPGWPSADNLEYYHTQDEIQAIEAQDRWDRHVTAVEIANKAIERAGGKQVSSMTASELNIARAALGIDLTMGTFPRDEVEKVKRMREEAVKKRAAATAALAARVLPSSVERRMRSQSPLKEEVEVERRMAPPSFMKMRTSTRKRGADAAAAGEGSSKKIRGE